MQILLRKSGLTKLLVAESMQLYRRSKSFWPVYDQYQDELFLLRTHREIDHGLCRAYDKMTNDMAKKLLDELIMSIEALGPKLRQAYLPKFRKVLPRQSGALTRSRTRSMRR
jgi:hypothetical protein